MANDPNNIRLGACRVRWGGRDLGLTKGGIDVEIKAETKTIDVDQFGKTIVQEYVMGRMVTVKVPFAETDLDTLYSLTKTSGGSLQDTGVQATGTLTFSGQPANNDTITVAGHVFTFATVRTAVDQIVIGTDLAATIRNAVRVLSSSSDSKVTQASYTATATTILIAAYKSGIAGNGITLAKSGTSVTASGATLTGGLDNTGLRYVTVKSGAGIGLYGTSQPLVLHPVDRADNDYVEDFIIPKANTGGSVQFKYVVDSERIFSVDFTGYVDLTSNNDLFKYGDTGVY